MPMLRWMGDEKARGNLTNVVMKILREDKALSHYAPCLQTTNAACKYGAENILVHGDNLEALKSLLPFYAGKVKCIYIDPPYNTGSAFEHYDDNLEHSQWLDLMYPRLKLLKEFMREDGSIWISIDDDEGHYLKVICDEIFGRQNFVATVIWEKKYAPQNDATWLSDSHDYILVYAKCKSIWRPNLLPRTDEMNARYKNPDNDKRGVWKAGDISVKTYNANTDYPITTPSGRVVHPPAGYCWRFSKERFEELVSDNRIWFGPKGNNVPAIKRFLCDVKQGMTAMTIWKYSEVGHNQDAKKEIKELAFESVFATPKPERLIQRILTLATNPGDLVMDSFLGSGTTAAVAQKMGRRWIGIEMGEHAKTHCAVRMKKVVDGEQGGISEAVGWKGGGGFRFYELGEAILKGDGTLTADIPFEVMAAHVWFTETKTPWDGFSSPRTVAASATGAGQRIGCYRAGRRGGDSTEVTALGSACRRGGDSTVDKNKSTVLGVKDGVAYALLYNGILMDRRVNGGNVLTRKTLEVIDEDLKGLEYERLVVYAEASRLMPSTLEERRIEFKQTPYDLVTRK